MNCEETQLAMAKQEHGLLDERAQCDVQAHVASCEACARMAALNGALQSLKHEPPREVPNGDQFIAHQRSRAKRAAACVVPIIAAVPFLSWILGASTTVVVVGAGMAVASALIALISVRRREARFRRLVAQPSPHFLGALRSHLEEDLRRANHAPLFGVACTALGVAFSFGDRIPWLLLVMGPVITCVGLYLRAKALPQLRAELAELQER
jgi:hypothetical protein